MKKLIFAVVLMLAIALASYGKPLNKNNGLLKELAGALISAQSVSIKNAGSFKATSFNFNGKIVSAYYGAESDDLLGFSIPMSVADLPQEALDKIKARFNSYTINSMIMFVENNGRYQFYVSLSRPNIPTIILDFNSKGKVHYFGKM